jgi:hypothetical protein
MAGPGAEDLDSVLAAVICLIFALFIPLVVVVNTDVQPPVRLKINQPAATRASACKPVSKF